MLIRSYSVAIFLSCLPLVIFAGKPNVVFFFIDDLGWTDLGYMGSKYYESPHIDRLAKEGMVFMNAYANAPNPPWL